MLGHHPRAAGTGQLDNVSLGRQNILSLRRQLVTVRNNYIYLLLSTSVHIAEFMIDSAFIRLLDKSVYYHT